MLYWRPGNAGRMSTVFLSYAREDEAVARTVAEALEKAGFAVWWDRQVPPGKTWDDVIGRALDAAGCVLVLWSGTSVQSRWVREEAERAASRNRLIPVLIEKVEPPFGFGRIQAANLSRWRGDERHPEFAGLVRAISDMAGTAHARPAPEEPRKRKSRLPWIAVSLIAAAVIAYVAWQFTRVPRATPKTASVIREPAPVRPIPAPPETLRRPVTVGRSHEGCVPFADPEDVIARGPITAIYISHEGYVHGIRIRYGTDGLGKTQGYTQGIPGDEWLVPAGERITRVEGEIAPATSGANAGYVSRLQFITDKGNRSPLFGARRGKPFAAAGAAKWSLRTISGQANLTRSRRYNRAIAGMTFHFGPPS
jgi:hypothetical protein